MPQILNETFDGVAGTLLQDYNPNWVMVTGVTGTVTISSTGTRARMTSGTNTTYYRADVIPPTADYAVTGELYVSTTAAGNAGICGRMLSTTATMYQVRIITGTGYQLYKLVGGSSTLLGTSPKTFVAGTTYTLRMELLGSNIRILADGVEILNVTDTAITGAGYIGIRSVTTTSGQVQWDTLTAETFGGALPTSVTVTPTGGTSLSGQVGTARQASRGTSGGTVLSGIGSVSYSSGGIQKTVTASGGFLVTGVVLVNRVGSRAAAGGETLSGTTTVSTSNGTTSKVVIASGGTTLAGQVPNVRTVAKAGRGGITLRGNTFLIRVPDNVSLTQRNYKRGRHPRIKVN